MDLSEEQLLARLNALYESKGKRISIIVDSKEDVPLVRNISDKFIINRKGEKEVLDPIRVYERNRKLAHDHPAGKLKNIDIEKISRMVCDKIYSGMHTNEIDELTESISYSMCYLHYEYDTFASRVAIDNDHKNNRAYTFYGFMKMLHENKNPRGEPAPLIKESGYKFISRYSNELMKMIDYQRDFEMFDYFGYKEIVKKLPCIYNDQAKTKKIVGGPQDLFLRVAIALHYDYENVLGKTETLNRIQTSYDIFSRGYYTHATPGLISALFPYSTWISCFLLSMSDSLDHDNNTYKSSISQVITDTMMISKARGGVGISVDGLRCKGSRIVKTNCKSKGSVPFALILDAVVPAVDQSGTRQAAISIYQQIFHADVIELMEACDKHGPEYTTGKKLFYGFMLNDVFFKREQENGILSFFDPAKVPDLFEAYGDKFEQLYEKYEHEGRYEFQRPAAEIRAMLIKCAITFGKGYLLQRDNINRTSNQAKNLGVVRMSNLCTEITTVTNDKQQGTCTLSSIGLPALIEIWENDQAFADSQTAIMNDIYAGMDPFAIAKKHFNYNNSTRKNVPNKNYKFNYAKLLVIAGLCTYNLDTVIDINVYPNEQTKFSSTTNRPIGIGMQGLADVYCLFGLPFDSEEACEINIKIIQHMYYGFIWFSSLLARTKGTYSTYKGSWVELGKLKFDLYDERPDLVKTLDWNLLRHNVSLHGIRNSYGIALMPTASTSQMLGNSESFAPYEKMVFQRETQIGKFHIINRFMQESLTEAGYWNEDLYQQIVQTGSLQNTNLPENVKKLFRSAYELGNKCLIRQAGDRERWVCQSQSFNLFINKDDKKILSGQVNITDLLWNAIRYGNSRKLGTLMYYLKQPTSDVSNQGKELKESETVVEIPIEEAVKPEPVLVVANEDLKETEGLVCSRDNPDCEACGS